MVLNTLLTHGWWKRITSANKPIGSNCPIFLHVKSHSCCYLLGTQPLTPGFPNPAHETSENSPAQSTASTPGGEREPSRLGRLLSGGGQAPQSKDWLMDLPMAILVPGRAARDGFWFELKVHSAMWRGTGMGRGLMVTG